MTFSVRACEKIIGKDSTKSLIDAVEIHIPVSWKTPPTAPLTPSPDSLTATSASDETPKYVYETPVVSTDGYETPVVSATHSDAEPHDEERVDDAPGGVIPAHVGTRSTASSRWCDSSSYKDYLEKLALTQAT